MTRGEELREQWNGSSVLRTEWDKYRASDSWKLLSAMIEAEAIDDAESIQRLDGDPVLARSLSRQIGARTALRKMNEACEPPPAPHQEIEEFAHVIPMSERD